MKQGLHREHLKLWEQELAEKMTAREQKYREENQGLKKELNNTKWELHKKEKALAELAALYTLKKKRTRSGGQKSTIDSRRAPEAHCRGAARLDFGCGEK